MNFDNLMGLWDVSSNDYKNMIAASREEIRRLTELNTKLEKKNKKLKKKLKRANK